MKDIKKYRGTVCLCNDVEDKYNTVATLEDYQVLINEKVHETMYDPEYPNLIVDYGQVKPYRDLRSSEDGFNSTTFINRLINCPDVRE